METNNNPDSSTPEEDKKPVRISFGKILLISCLFVFGIILFFLLIILNIFGFNNLKNFVNSYISSDSQKAINILLLGKSGGDNTAPDLTDTIMIFSINPSREAIDVISVPRDIWISSIRAKLNSAYYWGKEQKPEEPFLLVKDILKEISGIEIDGVVLVDFEALRGLVDSVGGIEVEVERDFTDKMYPIMGKENDLCGGDRTYSCRYETIEFKKGLNVMNGETVLKYVRSRNAEGDEGTDLARAVRQQRVILALKEKLTRPATIFSFWNYKKITAVIFANIKTDLEVKSLGQIAKSASVSLKSIKSHVVPEDYLVSPKADAKYDMQYVFIPKKGNWKEVIGWFENTLEGK